MARNFVIIYSGRTGSSPIVNILARQPGICVPVFENLDHRFIGKERAAAIPEILDAVFATGRLDGAALPDHLPRFPAGETPRSTGFKWRPYGDWARVCEVFRRHDVMLFVLSRRDFVEVASSLYITTHGNRLQDEVEIPTHPQFGIARGVEDSRDRIAKIQAMTFPVRPRLLYRIMRQQVRARADLVTLAREAHDAGVPVRALAYEDFTADNEGFVEAMLAEIGMAAPADLDLTSAFEKVMKVPAKSRLARLPAWLWLPPLRWQMLRYARTGRALDAVVAASRTGRRLGPLPVRTEPMQIRG
jgi:hypothetical protein